MALTRKEIKEEIKNAVSDSKSFESMVHEITIYIYNNYVRRKSPIDSEKILKKKRNEKKK